MEAFSLFGAVPTALAHEGSFADGLRQLPLPHAVADYAAGMRTRDARRDVGHFATGQSWHPSPYVGEGDFATGTGRRSRVRSAVRTPAEAPR